MWYSCSRLSPSTSSRTRYCADICLETDKAWQGLRIPLPLMAALLFVTAKKLVASDSEKDTVIIKLLFKVLISVTTWITNSVLNVWFVLQHLCCLLSPIALFWMMERIWLVSFLCTSSLSGSPDRAKGVNCRRGFWFFFRALKTNNIHIICHKTFNNVNLGPKTSKCLSFY